MKKTYLIISLLLSVFFAKATVHIVYLTCANIVSDSTNAVCGDTILWKLNGCTDTLKSTTIPGCVSAWKVPFSPTGNLTYQLAMPCAGSYYFTWHGFKGVIKVSCVTGLPQLEDQPLQAVISPNPARNNANISVSLIQDDFLTIDIYNVLGSKVSSASYDKLPSGDHTIPIDIKTLKPGIYFVKLNTGTTTIAKRLVVQ